MFFKTMIMDKNTVLSKAKLVLKFANRNRMCEKNLFLDFTASFWKIIYYSIYDTNYFINKFGCNVLNSVLKSEYVVEQ